MSLKMRPSGLGSGIDKDRADYLIFCGEWNSAESTKFVEARTTCAGSGRCTSPASLRTYATDNRVATLETAKAEFEASWKQWKAWAKMEEVE